MHVNSCLEIIHSPQGETETVTPSFHSSQIVQSNPLSVGSLGEEGGRPYFQTTRHTFSFQSPVFTTNISVTHFHHNPLVSMFSVKTVTDATHRRGTRLSFCLFILSLMAFPEPLVSKSIPKASYSELTYIVRVYPQIVCMWALISELAILKQFRIWPKTVVPSNLEILALLCFF